MPSGPSDLCSTRLTFLCACDENERIENIACSRIFSPMLHNTPFFFSPSQGSASVVFHLLEMYYLSDKPKPFPLLFCEGSHVVKRKDKIVYSPVHPHRLSVRKSRDLPCELARCSLSFPPRSACVFQSIPLLHPRETSAYRGCEQGGDIIRNALGLGVSIACLCSVLWPGFPKA